jgi:hypothetical protein
MQAYRLLNTELVEVPFFEAHLLRFWNSWRVRRVCSWPSGGE